MTRPGGSWRNWGRTARVRPLRIEFPSSAAAVARAVEAAARRRLPIKAIGSGHSFSPIGVAPGVLLDLSDLTGLVRVDADRGHATLLAGTPLWQIPDLLAPYGLAMENLGDIDRQTISGAISTGTHGTGAGFGGLATQVVGLTMVTGEAELIRIDQDHEPELLPAAVVGLGALGVITEVTLQCVPSFVIEAIEKPEPIAEVLASLGSRAAQSDHFEFYWFPHTDTALTKSHTRLPGDAELAALPAVGKWVDETLLSNGIFRVVCAAGTAIPAIIPPFSRFAVTLTGNRSYTDHSHRVFTQRRTVRFREMEYALPAENIPDAFDAVQRLIHDRRLQISFPIEVRFAAADDRWLSTAYGRETGYIAVHRYWRENPEEYFSAVERILVSFGGRPHWGKMHTMGVAELRERYPQFEQFRKLRNRCDPERRFANPYLNRVLDE